jgi:HEPN domain-containing protein
MLGRSELRKLAQAKLKDADALLKAKRFDGAQYTCGYAVELALKARLCTALQWAEFPDTNGEFEKLGLKSLKTHNLNVLLRFTRRESKIKSILIAEWSDLASWQPELRYKPVGNCTPQDARQMVESARTLVRAL